jgi:hypothetical protein
MHPSGLSQAIALSILEKLGKEGLEEHQRRVVEAYRKRRDMFCELAGKHLSGLAEWGVPDAGMFVWFRLLGVSDTMDLIQKKALDAKVLLVPGSSFFPDEGPSPYVRASFSIGSLSLFLSLFLSLSSSCFFLIYFFFSFQPPTRRWTLPCSDSQRFSKKISRNKEIPQEIRISRKNIEFILDIDLFSSFSV